MWLGIGLFWPLWGAISLGHIQWQGSARWQWDSVVGIDDQGRGAKSYGLQALSLQPRWVLNDQASAQVRLELWPPLMAQQPTGYLVGRGLGPYETQARSASPVVLWGFGQWDSPTGKGYIRLGRQPLAFGLGAYWNDASNPQDLFISLIDGILVGFQVSRLELRLGASSLKKSETAWGGGSQWLVGADYRHGESHSQIGVLWQQTQVSAGVLAQDPQWLSAYQGVGVAQGASFQSTHVYFRKGWQRWGFESEAGFESGSLGLIHSSGRVMRLGGFGVVAQLGELENPLGSFQMPQSGQTWRYRWRIQVGIASGDDPATAVYEGFQWHRNWDMAYLLRHPLGTQDLFRSRRIRSRQHISPYPLVDATQVIQEEALSNLIWIQGLHRWRVSSRWVWQSRIQFQQLHQQGVPGGWALDGTCEYEPDASWRVWALLAAQLWSSDVEKILGRQLPFQWGWQAGVSFQF